jgi:hypothetical protein
MQGCTERHFEKSPDLRLVFFVAALRCRKLLSFSIVKRIYSDSGGTDKKKRRTDDEFKK